MRVLCDIDVEPIKGVKTKEKIIERRKTIVQQMMALHTDTPRHMCYNCVFGLYLAETWGSVSDTHIDTNPCEYYSRLYEGDDEDIIATLPNDGNTRVHMSGYRTVDNGSGYDILECPYNVPMFEDKREADNG